MKYMCICHIIFQHLYVWTWNQIKGLRRHPAWGGCIYRLVLLCHRKEYTVQYAVHSNSTLYTVPSLDLHVSQTKGIHVHDSTVTCTATYVPLKLWCIFIYFYFFQTIGTTAWLSSSRKYIIGGCLQCTWYACQFCTVCTWVWCHKSYFWKYMYCICRFLSTVQKACWKNWYLYTCTNL